MRPLNLLVCLFVLWPSFSSAQECVSSANFWNQPRSVALLLQEKGYQVCIQSYLNNPRQTWQINHAKNEQAELEAHELRDWLVVIGVDPSAVQLVNDPTASRVSLFLR